MGSVVCHNDLAPRNTALPEGSRWRMWTSTSPHLPYQPGTSRTLAWQFVSLVDDEGYMRENGYTPFVGGCFTPSC